MITVKIKKKGKKLDNILASLKKIDGQKTQFGYFASQGRHTGQDGISDYTYAGLAQALELGYFPLNENPLRTRMRFMEIIAFKTFFGLRKSGKYQHAMRKWFKKLDKKGNPQVILDAVGWFAIKQSRTVFGNPRYFPYAKKGNDLPLITTGELMAHFTYRTSFDNKVRQI